MATRAQLDILDIIQREYKAAKKAKKNIPGELSGGQRKYKSAINTMISVGWLAEFVAIFVGVSLTASMVFTIVGGRVNDAVLIVYAFEMVVCVTTAVLGHKLAILDATPTFILVSLIIILITNVLIYSGILPLFNVILAILGLVRWSTYKDWFNNIDIKKSNSRKRSNRK